MDIIESSKRLAAYTAVDNHIKPEHKVSEMSIDGVITLTVAHQVIGIGSGTLQGLPRT